MAKGPTSCSVATPQGQAIGGRRENLKTIPAGTIRRRLRAYLGTDHVRHDGVLLPPKEMRPCGFELKDDRRWLESAQAEVERLVRNCGLTSSSRLLDLGCGPGPLAIGMIKRQVVVEAYRGLDVNRGSIDWCNRYIAKNHPSFEFVHLDVLNLRYNPAGRNLERYKVIPFRNREFSIIYAYSVFSHMVERDVRIYLGEIARLLAPKGRFFMTGFLEKGVPRTTINPVNYRKIWNGPLHCVRFEKEFFESMLSRCGLALDRFEYGTETGGQSALFIRKEA